ncbi:periplasmic heavy metal sensor [Mesorhizobium sp. M1C.F.Ca.ET.193.01.1.1]|uniref:periplasmic heavy metal sensor n=2 Tax=Mesorhizobium TaxID=68287 RepID=UPI000FD5F3D9|nr:MULTISPECIES: periplasmic heavy metal sensor [unclassified Mesorhizobium]TGT04204.1 periplasmic heavy metal sensor [bacterium M00.F.Ca.ET.177.01.1.1]RWA77462.1 MAG: periplasmic heavy metal sensor [Mesorhizobium sp.]RWC05736.1 MAG: periplasmic heavy metal sensor [Mesorhizobium sp.]RWG87773.1 MAG: periplasmic heavy metal sensor [Mesorhizobium sp.]RWG91607.1 MAG: periplasmic heavy metal sensor [Mesorhizobium sp.]
MSTRLFAASLVLNVFLIGAVAGGAGWLIGRSNPGYSLESAGSRLPADDRKAFRQALREVRREARAIILDGQQARREAANLLQQPTLDTNALAAALERARNADATIRSRLEQRIIEFAASSSPQDRKLLADALLRHVGRQRPPLAKNTP